MKENAWQMLKSSLCMQRSLEKDNGHSLVPVLRKSGTLSKRTVHKESGTISRKRCCWNLPKAHVQFSVLRLHYLEVNSEAKNMENCRYTMQETIETIFRIIVSANQLSLYGAVAEMCEEYESFHERTVRPVVMGQSSSSLVLSVIKTQVPFDCDDLACQDFLLQQYGERIEKLSQTR